jgi:hypothetical protein
MMFAYPYSCWRAGCSFWSIFQHRPYCAIDPTCTSFVGNGGFATNDFTDMNSFSSLAWSNYVLFLIVLSLLVVLVCRLLRRHPRWRDGVCLLVALWCGIEHLRWFTYMDWSELPAAHRELIWQTGLLFVGSICVLWLVRQLAIKAVGERRPVSSNARHEPLNSHDSR